jgi:hypothetical protein
VSAKPDGGGTRLQAAVDARGLPIGDQRVELDLTVFDRGDRLTVRPSRIGDLEFQGSVSGLHGEQPLNAEGRVQGSLPLDLDEVEGHLEFDGRVVTDAAGVHLTCQATAEDFQLRVEDYESPRGKLSIEADLREHARTWTGTASLISELVTVEAKRLRIAPDSLALRGRVETSDVDATLKAIPDLELPEELEFDGVARFENARVSRQEGKLEIDTVLEADRLTFLVEGVEVFRDEPVRGDVHLVTDGDRFDFRKTRIVAPERKLTVFSHEFRVREDGSWTTSGQVEAPLAYLPNWVPGLDRTGISGNAKLEAVLSESDRLRIETKGTVPDFLIHIGDKTLAGKLDLDVAGTVGGGTVVVERCVAAMGATTLNGTASFGQQARIEADLQGDLEPLITLLPHASGARRASLDLAYLGPLPGEPGEVVVTGSVRAHELDHPDVRFEDLDGELSLAGRLTGNGIERARFRFRGNAAHMRLDALDFEQCGLTTRVSGTVRDGDFGPGLDFDLTAESRRLDLDGVIVEDARSEIEGVLKRNDLDPGRTGRLAGKIEIGAIRLPALVIGQGEARIELNHGILGLRDFRAEVNDGRVRGSGRFDIRREPIRWEVDTVFTDLKLREELGNPLSLLVPIMRLTPFSGERLEETRSRLTGTIGADLR